MQQESIFSEKIDVGVTSNAQFNVIAYLEGPNKQYLHYIEEQAHCRITINDAINSGFNPYDNTQISLLIATDTDEDLQKARNLCQNLIETVKAQKARVTEAKARKRAKKRKSGQKAINLPEQLLLAMKFYYPGEPAEPPPPGSTQDLKIHKREFPRIAKQMKWFKQTA
ncbi:KH domain containing protein [Tritrichomonas foetus]|uniref:KH domain containing protein n=1 Tax=Tritrichomonas foetus TaxID=1144522 RepID=A0A1J4KPW8_9EUKA|nr:KH domain containing protein [Tritrichomonas foetus]|eukprot:OHT13353.1 KH domain containing protein [Tritrichomonas foetus]